MKVAVLSGGFDPIHSGHIAMINEARKLVDPDGCVIVGINSDAWLTRKKGKPFMPMYERGEIVAALASVDDVMLFNDDDDTARKFLEKVKSLHPTAEIIFCNGGDRTDKNIPEMDIGGIRFMFGIGGANKANSSSWILKEDMEYKEQSVYQPVTDRKWGSYKILHDTPNVKVKELIVNPNSTLSMQRHFKRAEHWFVSKGKCVVYPHERTVNKYARIHLNIGDWHQLTNPFDEPCHVIEIQYGDKCIEEDIERR